MPHILTVLNIFYPYKYLWEINLMIVEAAAATVLTTVAQTLTKKVGDSVNTAMLPENQDLTNSLTAYVKSLTLQSRAYIDGSIATDPVVTDILKTCHNLYGSLVLAAIQMNQYVSKTERVRDMIGVVATESLNGEYQAITFGMESTDSNSMYVGSKPAPTTSKTTNAPQVPNGITINNASGEILSFAGDNHIPSGKVLKVTLTHPDNPKEKAEVTLQILIRPYLLPNNVALAFLTKDAIPSYFQRWLMWRAGEISFWSDLVFNIDQIQKRNKAIRDDKTGLLSTASSDQLKKAGKTAANLAKADAVRSRNIANSIMIFSKDTVVRAKNDTGFDLFNAQDRERYFAMSFCMFLVIVDPAFLTVTMYFNGVDHEGTYTFDQMKVGSKGGTSSDIVSILQALGQGKAPRF